MASKKKAFPPITQALLDLMDIQTGLKVHSETKQAIGPAVSAGYSAKLEKSIQVIQRTIQRAARILEQGIEVEGENADE
jgi:hypothetical protein